MSAVVSTVLVSGQSLRPRLPFATGLWGHPDFLRLWAGQTVSLFGSEITLLALPLTAVLVLGATPAQVGLLTAVERLPYLLVGLFAGVLVDRARRRPILLAADLGRGVLLGSIPCAALLGVLRLEQLFVVAFLTGVLTVFFAVAYQSYLPSLVGRDRLLDGNGKLETTRSAAEVAGLSLGGALIQAVTAPVAIMVDALSFLVSGACLCLIRRVESQPSRPVAGAQWNIWCEIREGLAVTFGDPVLRPLATCAAAMNLSYQALFAVYVIYLTQTLGFESSTLGAILAAGSGAGVLGAAGAARVARRLGIGRAITAGAVLSGVAGLAIPLADGPRPMVVAILMAAQVLLVLGMPIYNVNAVSLRQIRVPMDMLGRVTASSRFVMWGAMPIGAALGGLLGDVIGLRPAMWIACGGLLLASLLLVRSPVPALREISAKSASD